MKSTLPRRLDELQRRHPWLGVPVAVVFKFFDDHGVYLSVLITYYGFLALFPMMLLLTSLLGFVLDGQPELRRQIMATAVAQFPVIGTQISQEGFGGSTTAVVVGALVAVWAAVRASQATLHMMNICWAVPRHQRPDPIRSPIRALPLIAIAGLMLVGTTVGTVLTTEAGAYGVELRRIVPYVVMVISFIVAVLVFSLGMWVGTSYPLDFPQTLPGALVAALGWLLLQRFGIAYANQIVSRTGDTYGVFAVVLGLLVFIFVAAQLVVFAVEVNVVLVKRLYPRALLGPFTTAVPLTEADRRTYRDAAMSTQIKDYQDVAVTFDHPLGRPRAGGPPGPDAGHGGAGAGSVGTGSGGAGSGSVGADAGSGGAGSGSVGAGSEAQDAQSGGPDARPAAPGAAESQAEPDRPGTT